jgi:two-component system, OmpR family, sensor histidine kinase MprB
MTIRRRMSLAAACAVAVAVALASTGAYLGVRAKLRGEIDGSLRARATEIQQVASKVRHALVPVPVPGGPPIGEPHIARFGGAGGVVQFVTPGGTAVTPPGADTVTIPVDPGVRSVALGRKGTTLADEHVGGQHLRVITAPVDGGGAIQVARPLNEVDSVLNGLVILLAAITAGGIALAAVLGGVVSRASLGPIRRFTARTEAVAAAPLLGQRLEVETDDELGRLARSFNETLAALERSVAAQRQLVADASHELRTPLASLKTNVEVLQREAQLLAPREREELLHDLHEQADELTLLVSDVVDLARNGEPRVAFDDVALDELVASAVDRARRHAPEVVYRTELEPTVVRGVPERLDRAVANLLQNAAKWSRGGHVEVKLEHGELTVRDHGPGFDPDDLPYVFDRFYRARSARSLPGSGLGLAIVRQVAESHGATVQAGNAEGGGACLRMAFPNGNGRVPAA